MDLPTYTSIWRIEKRLYKLYDFRLPMPLPVGQITVFAAIAIPYVVLLTLLGVPLSHTLIWLYLLPPGVATWLVTRPVLEGKRLPELIGSQLRYFLAEPRVWCRMAPMSESEVTVLTGKVWRLSPEVLARLSSQVGRRRSGRSEAAARASARLRRPALRRLAERTGESQPTGARPVPVPAAVVPAAVVPAAAMREAVVPVVAPARSGLRARGRGTAGTGASAVVAGAGRPSASAMPPLTSRVPAQPSAPARPMAPAIPAGRRPTGPRLAAPPPAGPPPAPPASPPPAPRPAGPPPAGPPLAPRPAVTVVSAGAAPDTALPVERVLAGPSGRRGDGRTGRVTVVPGGHRPGKPDQLQRDRVRAALPLAGHYSIVVLGCTVGAGQTVTTLLTGEVLASLRTDSVAVLDLNPSQESLARRALLYRPSPGQASTPGPSRLAVLGTEAAEEGTVDPAAAAATFEQATAAHRILLADPSTVAVPRLLAIADQLVLVAPASSAAPRAISMTFEWLEAHGVAGLASGAVMVMNGVSRQSTAHVEQAERVCIGRCRAIVRVPWDDQLKNNKAANLPVAAVGDPPVRQVTGSLSPGTVSAYTALAGVLVAALAGPDAGQSEGREADASTGQAVR